MNGNLPFLQRQMAAGIIIMSIAMLGCWLVNQAEAEDVDGAMQAFRQAMVSKNSTAIFAAFSQKSPWKYQPYDINSGSPLTTGNHHSR